MKIKLSIIMYLLHRKYVACMNESEVEFESANLLSISISEFNPNVVYIGKLSDYLLLKNDTKGVYFICVDDVGFGSKKDFVRKYPEVVIVENEDDPNIIFNEIINIMFKLDGWSNSLQNTIFQNKGLQSIVDLSEELLGMHVDILDENFKLLAYTKNISTSDPITNELIETGSHSKEVIERFYGERIIEEFEKSDDLIIVNESDFTKYNLVIKVLHINKCRELFVVMLLDNNEKSTGFLDLFKMFIDYVEKFCVKAFYSTDEYGDLYNLISDMLEGNKISKEEAFSRAAFINTPNKDGYLCITIKFEDETNVLINRFINIINRDFYSCSAFAHKKRLVIIYYCDHGKANVDDICERLKSVLFPLRYFIGVSNEYEYIWEVPLAYEQTEAVLECATKIDAKYPPKENAPVYQFEDYFIEILVFKGGIANDIFRNAFMYKSIQMLESASRDKGIDLIKILDVYFNNACRATDAGHILNMHRNSVLYHISKIEHLLGVSLEDPKVSVKLRLAIMIYNTGLLM